MDGDHRRRALVEAGIAITSELSLDAVLQTLIRIAAELTGARYSALGVIDRTGRELERFVTHGVDDATRAAIGDLPRGRGILGVLITDARPLRLDDISRDPRSVGFPPNHPPMGSFLGVPVMTRGVAFGNLYLAEKQPAGGFTDEDEEITTLLAAQAAVAIENAGSVQRDALRRAVQAQEIERRRLARELHDETGQALTSILLGLSAVERAEDTEAARLAARALRELVVETLQNVRRLAVELRPSLWTTSGSSRRSAGSVRRCAKEAISTSRWRRGSVRTGCRRMSRRRSTASCRRRSPTWSSTRAPPMSASCCPASRAACWWSSRTTVEGSMPPGPRPRGSACWECASGWSSWTGRSGSRPRLGRERP